MEKDCPFCNRVVVNLAFARQNGFYAIYNRAPVVQGHSLIIPFKHIIDIFELNEQEYAELFLFARKVTRFLSAFYSTNEFDISLQQGKNAGQSVEHLHLHILPRKANDLPEGEEWFHKLKEEFITLDAKNILSDEVLKEISLQLQSAWNEQKY